MLLEKVFNMYKETLDIPFVKILMIIVCILLCYVIIASILTSIFRSNTLIDKVINTKNFTISNNDINQLNNLDYMKEKNINYYFVANHHYFKPEDIEIKHTSNQQYAQAQTIMKDTTINYKGKIEPANKHSFLQWFIADNSKMQDKLIIFKN